LLIFGQFFRKLQKKAQVLRLLFPDTFKGYVLFFRKNGLGCILGETHLVTLAAHDITYQTENSITSNVGYVDVITNFSELLLFSVKQLCNWVFLETKVIIVLLQKSPACSTVFIIIIRNHNIDPPVSFRSRLKPLP
jgi:hypothetical protein